MKLIDTLYYFVPVMIGAAGLVASIAFGSVDAESGAGQTPVTASGAAGAAYFPAQFTLQAPNEISEHVQAF